MLDKIKLIGEFIAPVITIIGATSAFWYFILYENVEIKYKTANETLQVKNQALKDDRNRLELENEKLTLWLKETPNTVPYFERSLKNKNIIIDSLGRVIKELLSSSITKIDTQVITRKYRFSNKYKEGESFIDPLTNSTVSIYNIQMDYSATARVSYPNAKEKEPTKVSPGISWDDILYKNRRFKIIVQRIDPLFDEFIIEIIELDQPN